MKLAFAFAFLAGVPLLTPDHIDLMNALRGAGALWMYSAVIQALPAPTPTVLTGPAPFTSRPVYAFLYKLAHLLGANLPQAGVLKGPKL